MSLPILSSQLTPLVNASYESGEMMQFVTPLTSELLKFWFDDAYCDSRQINFHAGQKQAILNTIFCHEVLHVTSVEDMYSKVHSSLSLEDNIIEEILDTKRYSFPRYCMKMATGTGKTFVLHALLIWQYLNAWTGSHGFSKNFLLIAPGLIVYERLLDAFMGKHTYTGDTGDATRDFSTSDYARYQELFLPFHHRDTLFNFVQGHTVAKHDIGRKVVGDEQIIITNRQSLVGKDDSLTDEDEIYADNDNDIGEPQEAPSYDPYEHPDRVLRELIPAKPGKNAGNSLDVLDKNYLKGSTLEYCRRLPSLIVFNDEAHHLGTLSSSGTGNEDKKWQQAVNHISEKKHFFTQVDFSATPYVQKGSKKIFFPHIITDFPIQEAIKQCLVKMITIDKRSQVTSLKDEDLNYMALRDDNNKVIGLSEGQKVMIQAGLSKLKKIDEQFSVKIVDEHTLKHPKLLIVCEDTKVVPYVGEFLLTCGYSAEEFIEIHSDKKGDVSPEERAQIKYKVFSIDSHVNPKIIISVMMLKEGFDVNNICVIVPLRSSSSSILLEQIIGRGLRLMRRGNQAFDEIRRENIRNLLNKKIGIDNYIDVLSIVEHPKYYDYRQELQGAGVLAEDLMTDDEMSKNAVGDLIPVSLKEDYKQYDLFWPIVLHDINEILQDPTFSPSQLAPMPGGGLQFWKSKVGDHEVFRSEAVLSGTRFGDYEVNVGIMTAQSYNDYLAKLVTRVTQHTNLHKDDNKLNKKGFGSIGSSYYPTLQINMSQLAKVTDTYLRDHLFEEHVDYLEDNNWRVLMIDAVANHIISQLVHMIFTYQSTPPQQVGIPIVQQRRLSEVDQLTLRSTFCVPVQKSIYPLLSYPSNKGGTEKDFMIFLDADGDVQSFCKIHEYKHAFLRLRYIREDGIPAYYHPDFIVKTQKYVFIVETKASKDISSANVIRKKKSAIYAVNKINQLPLELRDNRTWSYVLLGDTQFYILKEANASFLDIMKQMEISVSGETLFG